MGQDYIAALKNRLATLQDELIADRGRLRELDETIRDKQKQVDNLLQLLAAEGVSLDQQLVTRLDVPSISDQAYAVLSSQSTPLHYRKLAELILQGGGHIPGRDPAANLLAHIGRDSRFVRSRRGVYGLAEWER